MKRASKKCAEDSLGSIMTAITFVLFLSQGAHGMFCAHLSQDYLELKLSLVYDRRKSDFELTFGKYVDGFSLHQLKNCYMAIFATKLFNKFIQSHIIAVWNKKYIC
jgi:hypothetical protein